MNDKCYKTRKIILPPIGRGEVELLTPELENAKLHLKECKECQSFFTQQDEFRKSIKNNLPIAKASSSIREGILQLISERKKRRASFLFIGKGKLLKYSSIAAAIIIALAISLLFLDPFDTSNSKITETRSSEISGSQLTEALIDDYIRYRLSEQPVEYETNNPQELNNWFSRRLDFNARFLSIDELQLVGGRLCYLFDRRVALAFYSQRDANKQAQWASLFIFKDNHINLSKMKTEKIDDKIIWCNENNGYELAVWKQNDLLYALVADAKCIELVEKLLNKI
jgi:hypothetical protein